MIEEWKVVEGYSRYKVSDQARVWDTEKDLEVAQVLTGIPQYYYVNMQRDDGERKLVRVHRLVAKAFVEGETEEFRFVDHIDRNKLNNLPSNLRWVDNSGNQRNLESNIYVGDVFLKDYVQRYDNPDAAYMYIASRAKRDSVEQTVANYEEFLEYGHKRHKVEFKGEEVYLMDLVVKYHKDYLSVSRKLSAGIDIWNALFDVSTDYPYSFEIREKGVMYWYSSQVHWVQENGRSDDTLKRGLERDWSTGEIVTSDGLEDKRITVLGIEGTVKELAKHFGVSYGCVQTRTCRKGWSIEKALTTPQERVRRWDINGVTKSVSDWCKEFNIDPKRLNSWKSDNKASFKEALIKFGVDCSDKEFQPGD